MYLCDSRESFKELRMTADKGKIKNSQKLAGSALNRNNIKTM
jgi:hypothetical protein